MAQEVTVGTVQHMVDSGLIFEANRRYLHPRGIHLAGDITHNRLVAISTDDTAGYVYPDNVMAPAPDRYWAVEAMVAPDRETAFGWDVQPVEPEGSGS